MDQHNHVSETAVVTRAERQPKPLVDNNANGSTYTGYAQLGTSETEPNWLITRTQVRGTVTYTEYASGSLNYNQRWAQRESLYYAR